MACVLSEARNSSAVSCLIRDVIITEDGDVTNNENLLLNTCNVFWPTRPQIAPNIKRDNSSASRLLTEAKISAFKA